MFYLWQLGRLACCPTWTTASMSVSVWPVASFHIAIKMRHSMAGILVVSVSLVIPNSP
jgi:hypothetical protein